jgi:hypothetical protein
MTAACIDVVSCIDDVSRIDDSAQTLVPDERRRAKRAARRSGAQILGMLSRWAAVCYWTPDCEMSLRTTRSGVYGAIDDAVRIDDIDSIDDGP